MDLQALHAAIATHDTTTVDALLHEEASVRVSERDGPNCFDYDWLVEREYERLCDEYLLIGEFA